MILRIGRSGMFDSLSEKYPQTHADGAVESGSGAARLSNALLDETNGNIIVRNWSLDVISTSGADVLTKLPGSRRASCI
jgi:hypothetical protein